MSGVLITLGVVGILSILLLWLYTTSEPEIPQGVTIIHKGLFSWNYVPDDPRLLRGTGYLTRAAAIRAARAEIQRLEERTGQ